MGGPVTYEKINDLTARNLLGDLMEGKLNVDDYRKISRALNDVFSYLTVNQLHQEKEGSLNV